LLDGKGLNIAGHEQIPVEGIEFPGQKSYAEYQEGFPPVIYGIIPEDSIGYIYYLQMLSADNVSRLKDATTSLAQSEVKGIIIDLRCNPGGFTGWETGLNPIFNRTIDSCGWYARDFGGDPADLYNWNPYVFSKLSPEFMNKPIALITGPGAFSGGDYASYFIHSQPMTRSFGKGSNTAYIVMWNEINSPDNYTNPNLYWDFGYPEWEFQIATRNFGRIIDGELKYFLHNGFDVDEEIWFTQEAAYQQRDNIVDRAVQWIKSVAYAENCAIQDPYISPGPEADPFVITTGIENPESHPIELYAMVYYRDGPFIEQIKMQENSDGAMPGMNKEKWFGTFSPDPDYFYYAEISTYDIVEDSWLTYPGNLIFTTVNKPEIFPKTLYFPAGSTKRFDLTLTNTSEISLNYPQLKFSCSDPMLDIKNPVLNFVSVLKKDESAKKSAAFKINGTVGDNYEIWMNVDIYESSEHYWSDSILIIAQLVGEEDFQFSPELNVYPNPMKEFCRIQISGPVPLDKIELYDLSGRLVFTETNIGENSFELPKGYLENGIYVLKVHADKIYERKLVVQ
jgi:hypothetical protein